MEPDDIGVILERRLFYGSAQDFVDPPPEVSFQRFVVAIKDDSSDPVRDGLRLYPKTARLSKMWEQAN